MKQSENLHVLIGFDGIVVTIWTQLFVVSIEGQSGANTGLSSYVLRGAGHLFFLSFSASIPFRQFQSDSLWSGKVDQFSVIEIHNVV